MQFLCIRFELEFWDWVAIIISRVDDDYHHYPYYILFIFNVITTTIFKMSDIAIAYYCPSSYPFFPANKHDNGKFSFSFNGVPTI